MDVSLDILALLFIVATIAGFIDAIAGGGGLLTLPALLAAGVPPTQALATNKLQSSFGSFSASLYFVRTGAVNLKSMWLAILCTFIGSAVGAVAVQYMDTDRLMSVIPLLLIAISVYFLLYRTPQKPTRKLSEIAFAFLIGTSVGFYDGFLGPGTGSIFSVCFIAFAGYSMVAATAHTKILNFTSNIAALLLFIIAGLPLWKLGFVMAIGGFLGARLGAKVVIGKGQKWIKPLVIVMSMSMAIKLLIEQHPHWFGLG